MPILLCRCKLPGLGPYWKMANTMKNETAEAFRTGKKSVQHSPRFKKGDRFSKPIGIGAVFSLAILLILPTAAILRYAHEMDWRILFGAPLSMSVITFFTYRDDKGRAQRGNWRIPEATLHCLELFGGWPGAFLAQRRYRHKTVKASFQFAFWLIIVGHQLLALDSLFGWRIGSLLFGMILRIVKSL